MGANFGVILGADSCDRSATPVGTRSLQLTKKPPQKAARSTQLIGDQECSFWQWFKQPSDLPNSGIYERNRALHRHVLAQPDRHKSDQIGTIDTCQNENATIGRTKAQNPRCSAQKKGNLQRHETIADKSLQAFLAAIAVRTWDEIRHRYNLKKAAQVGTRSTQIGSNRHDRHTPKRECGDRFYTVRNSRSPFPC